ncbi:MAG TPA: hypothetical protein VF438_04020 [Candidatus Paceibacterota bacterium]
MSAAFFGWFGFGHTPAHPPEAVPVVVRASTRTSQPAVTQPTTTMSSKISQPTRMNTSARPKAAASILLQSSQIAAALPARTSYSYGIGSGGLGYITLPPPGTSQQTEQNNDNSSRDSDHELTVPTISLGSITKNFGDPTFTLAATTNSGGTVSYTSTDASVATISGTTVTIIGAGTTTVTASVATTTDYTASSTSAILVVNRILPTITFASITKNFGDAAFTPAPSSNSPGAFTFTSASTTIATASGSNVTIVGAGTTTITATQATTTNYFAISTSTLITVNAIAPTIGSLSDVTKHAGDTSFTLTDPTSSSSGPFTYSITGIVASVVDHTVTLSGFAGSAIITATQAAQGNYTSASTTMTLTVLSGYCDDHAGVCNTGVCSNQPDYGFSCACDASTTGTTCDQCSDFYNTCVNGSTCIPIDGAAYCQCDANFCGMSCANPSSELGGACTGGGLEPARPPLSEAFAESPTRFAALFDPSKSLLLLALGEIVMHPFWNTIE